MGAAPADELLRRDLAAGGGLEHDDGLHRLAAVRVDGADDARLLHVGMRVEHRLDLRRPDLVARGVDHALEAVDDEEVSLLVVAAEVAGAEERLAVQRDEAGCGRLGALPVALEDLRPAGDDLADLVRAEHLERVRVDHSGVGVAHGDAEALLLRALVRIGVGRGDGLGQAVALDVVEPGEVLEALRDRFGHGGAAAADARQAGQVVLAQVRVGQEVDGHGRDVGPALHPVALDEPRCGVAVPPAHQHAGRAQVDGNVHAALHAGDVEQRERAQNDVILVAVAAPLRHDHDRAHHRGVGVDAAFGTAGRSGGVGHHAQVVGAGEMGTGRKPGRQSVGPQRHARLAQGLGLRLHRIRQGQVGGAGDVVAIGCDDGMLQACVEQRSHLGEQLLPGEDHGGIAVVHVVAQLLGEVHRVHRHDHGVGAQDGVEADEELRTVLHEQQHAVAALHATALLEIAGKRQRLRSQLRVAHRRVVEDHRRLVRIACRRHLQVVEQAGLREGQFLRQVLRPEPEMAGLHLPPPAWMSRSDSGCCGA